MRICPHCETPTLEPICPDDGYQTVDAALYMDPDQDPFVGTVFHNRYRIESRIDIGGMSTVYRATQLAVGRPVALKIMTRELAKDLKAVARFQQEARAVAGLRHPNTIRLFDYGQSEDGHLFLVMEFLEGEPLSAIIDREAPFPPERAIHVARQILDALAEAHGKGIVHRDLKPDNIFVSSVGLQTDYIKILDFGIAKVTHEEGRKNLTGTGLVLGSPGYMAPEQVTSQPSTEQTDIYAVGALLYEMLTGLQLFQGESAIELAVKHVQDEPPPLIAHGELLEGPLVEFVLACLKKRPADRPAGAAGALQGLMSSESGPLRPGWKKRPTTEPFIRAVSERDVKPPARSTMPRLPAVGTHKRPSTGRPLSQPVPVPAPTTPTTAPQRFDVPMKREPSTLSAHSRRVSTMGFQRSRHRIWLPITVIVAAAVIAGAVWFVREYGHGKGSPKGEDPLRARGTTTGQVADAAGGGAPVPATQVDAYAATVPLDAGGVAPADAGPVAPATVDAGSAKASDAGAALVAAADVAAPVAADASAAKAADAPPAAGEVDFVELVTYPAGAKVQVNFAKRGGEYKDVGKTPFRLQWAKGSQPPRVKLRKYHHETHRMSLRPWQFGRTLRIELEYDDSW